LKGLPSGYVRKPLGELNEEEKQSLESVLKTLETSMVEIENGPPETVERDTAAVEA